MSEIMAASAYGVDDAPGAASSPQSTRRPIDNEEGRLIRRIEQGDEQAFNRLYDRYTPHLRRYLASRLAQQPELVDEALNDTMLTLWRDVARLPPHTPLVAWLCGIARYKAMHAYARANSVMPSRDAPTGLHHDGSESPERAMLLRERQARFRHLLTELPALQRQLVEVIALQQGSYAEVAERTGHSIGALRKKLYVTRRWLQARMAAEPELPSEPNLEHMSR